MPESRKVSVTARLFYFPQIDAGEFWSERPFRIALWVDAGDGRQGWMMTANQGGAFTVDEARERLKAYRLYRDL